MFRLKDVLKRQGVWPEFQDPAVTRAAVDATTATVVRRHGDASDPVTPDP